MFAELSDVRVRDRLITFLVLCLVALMVVGCCSALGGCSGQTYYCERQLPNGITEKKWVWNVHNWMDSAMTNPDVQLGEDHFRAKGTNSSVNAEDLGALLGAFVRESRK